MEPWMWNLIKPIGAEIFREVRMKPEWHITKDKPIYRTIDARYAGENHERLIDVPADENDLLDLVNQANLFPELVEALEDLVGQWDQGMTCGAIPDSRSHRESVDNARAVLAKAKGE